jgi:hypothetical protein
MAAIALIKAALLDHAVTRAAASRAHKTLGPAPCEQGSAALLLGAVKRLELRIREALLKLYFVAWHAEPPDKADIFSYPGGRKMAENCS